MSTAIHQTPGSKPQERQSLFFRDLASPISAHRASRFATPGQAAAVSALWRENFTSDDPPPPPVFTLEDRIDFSPDPAVHEIPASPGDPKTPTPARNYFSSPSPIRTKAAEGSGSAVAGSGGWWGPAQGSEEKGKGSPVEGVVKVSPGALVMLPPPREVARPEMRSQTPMVRDGMLDEEEWVTVYGYDYGFLHVNCAIFSFSANACSLARDFCLVPSYMNVMTHKYVILPFRFPRTVGRIPVDN